MDDRHRIAELEKTLGHIAVLLLQEDYEEARTIALTLTISFTGGEPVVLGEALSRYRDTEQEKLRGV